MTRYTYLSFLRVLAILFVVFFHSFCPYGAWEWINCPTGSIPDLTNKLLEPFVAMMPLLTFISGYLFNFIHNKYQRFSTLFWKKIQRLIIPMLFFGLIYSYFLSENFGLNASYLNQLFSGYNILWYCNMLFLCFMVAYPICRHLNNISIQLLILILSFGLIYIKCPAILGSDAFCRMFFYFYFGCCFSTLVTNLKIQNKSLSSAISLIGLIGGVSYLIFEINSIGNYNIHIVKLLSGNALRICLLIFSILMSQNMEHHLKYCKSMQFLDQNSFGCYIFHYPIIYFLYKS